MNSKGKTAAILATGVLWLFLADRAFTAEAQRSFATPQQAADAAVDAIRHNDNTALAAILGPGSETIVSSGDPAADRQERHAFLDAYAESVKLVRQDSRHVIVAVGEDEWPMPIPIVKHGSRWVFDTAAGKQELLARRIGRNELFTIESCLAYVDAQREYASEDRGDGVLDYAQKFVSTPGKEDGLYWPEKAGVPESPLGPLFADARAEGYSMAGRGTGTPQPYHGYYYKILTAQGPGAPGGAYSYVAKGHMIGGFALVAWPATYGVTGNTTFLVNQDGAVFEKDLGPRTAELAAAMTRFDPVKWARTRGTIAER
jgi:hypothetical protein